MSMAGTPRTYQAIIERSLIRLCGVLLSTIRVTATMGSEGQRTRDTMLPPEDAFSALGNEVRMEILRILGEADEPMSFSDLRSTVGIDDPGRFNYHLTQLIGHFVTQSDDGYELKRPGQHIIEAVLAGAVTEAPVLESTEVDWACHFCESTPIYLEYREGQLGAFCSECSGMYGGEGDGENTGILPAERQRLWYAELPPPAIQNRSPEEIVEAAGRWAGAEIVTRATGMCPKCAATIQETLEVCADHVQSDGLCPNCNRKFAALHRSWCTNCIDDAEVMMGSVLARNLEFRAFMIDHGFDPIVPRSAGFRKMFYNHTEEILSYDPPKLRFTFSVENETISLTVDDTIEVVDVERSRLDG